MFGLEDQKKKKKIEEFIFDLEKDLQNSKKNAEVQAKVLARIQMIKEILQGGIDKADFDLIGRVLYGYSSLQKVIGRFKAKT